MNIPLYQTPRSIEGGQLKTKYPAGLAALRAALRAAIVANLNPALHAIDQHLNRRALAKCAPPASQ